jgi:hypothetical protein
MAIPNFPMFAHLRPALHIPSTGQSIQIGVIGKFTSKLPITPGGLNRSMQHHLM